jgi:hypothetical protein
MTPRKKIKVKDNPSLVRDSFSKAIINVDRNTYTQSRTRKKNLLEKDQKIASLEEAMETLRQEQAELVKLVKSMTKKA